MITGAANSRLCDPDHAFVGFFQEASRLARCPAGAATTASLSGGWEVAESGILEGGTRPVFGLEEKSGKLELRLCSPASIWRISGAAVARRGVIGVGGWVAAAERPAVATIILW